MNRSIGGRTIQDFDIVEYGGFVVEPPVSSVGRAATYYDLTTKKLMLSVDGGGWKEMVVGAIDLSGYEQVNASVQFGGLDAFTTTVSRRGRTRSAKSMTTWEMIANASGSASVTIKKASYANYPSTLTTIGTITLTTAQKATGSQAVSLSAGDYIIFELTSCSGITDLDVELF